MHFTVCIPVKKDQENIEEKVNSLLERFDLNKQVEPYKKYIAPKEIKDAAEHYNLQKHDLHALAEKMQNWSGFKGSVDEKGLYQMRTDNPDEQTDYWSIYDKITAEELKCLARCIELLRKQTQASCEKKMESFVTPSECFG